MRQIEDRGRNRSANSAAATDAASDTTSPPRRPSIKESTPAMRSMATRFFHYDEGTVRNSRQSGNADIDPSPPLSSLEQHGSSKEDPYVPYPSSIGRFFSFRGGSGAAATFSSSGANPVSGDAFFRDKSPLSSPLPTSLSTVLASLDSHRRPPKERAGAIKTTTGPRSATVSTQSSLPPVLLPASPALASSFGMAVAAASNTNPSAIHANEASTPPSLTIENHSPEEEAKAVVSATASTVLSGLDEESWRDFPIHVRYRDLPPLYSSSFASVLSSKKNADGTGTLPSLMALSTPQPVLCPRSAFRVSSLPLSLVLRRIASFLRHQSVACDPAGLVLRKNGTLTCVTPRHCRFAVMLWRPVDDDDDDGASDKIDHWSSERQLDRPSSSSSSTRDADVEGSSPVAVVIAIERRQGCCVELQRMRRSLKKAIESGEYGPDDEGSYPPDQQLIGATIRSLLKKRSSGRPEASSSFSLSPSKLESGDPTATQQHSRPAVRRRSSLEGISACSSLLASRCRYRQQLGLENLVALTDPTGRYVHGETTLDTAAVLLLVSPPPSQQQQDQQQSQSREPHKGHPSGEVNEVDDEVIRRLQRDFVSFFSEGEGSSVPWSSLDLAEGQAHGSVRRSLALQALGNALQVARESCRCDIRVAVASAMRNRDEANKVPWALSALGHHCATSSTCGSVLCCQNLDFSAACWRRCVVPSLLVDVTCASSRPHDAAISAKCLFLLQDLHRRPMMTCSGGGDNVVVAPAVSSPTAAAVAPTCPSSAPATGCPASPPVVAVQPPPTTTHLQPSLHADDCWLCHGHKEALLPYLDRARSYGSRHHRLLESECSRLIRCLQPQHRPHWANATMPREERQPQRSPPEQLAS